MPEVFIHINQEGKIINRKVLKQAFSDLEAGRYSIKIDRANKRSLSQNNFYWGCVVPLVKDGLRDIGYSEIRTNEQAHEVMKTLFLKCPVRNENTDEVIEIAGSTKNLTTIEFNAYIEQIAEWCSTYLGFALPLPNEQLQMNY